MDVAPLPGPGGGAAAGFGAQDALSRCVAPQARLGSILTRGGTVLLGGAEGQPAAPQAHACTHRPASHPRTGVSPSTEACAGVGHAAACTPGLPRPWVRQPARSPIPSRGHLHGSQVGRVHCSPRPGGKAGGRQAAGAGLGRKGRGARAHAGSRTQSLGLPPPPEAGLGVPPPPGSWARARAAAQLQALWAGGAGGRGGRVLPRWLGSAQSLPFRHLQPPLAGGEAAAPCRRGN